MKKNENFANGEVKQNIQRLSEEPFNRNIGRQMQKRHQDNFHTRTLLPQSK